MNKLTLLTVLLFVTHLTFGQWSQGKNKGYFKLSAWYLNTDQYFNETGNIEANLRRTQFNISLYGEYGISQKIDLLAHLPFFARTTQDNTFSTNNGTLVRVGEEINALGDLDLGFNYHLFRSGNWSASVKLLFGLPTGENAGGSDGSYQTGDGEFNQYLSGHLGYSNTWVGLPYYVKSYFGFNNRTDNFSDEIRLGLESGFNLFQRKLWLIGKIDAVQSLQNGNGSSRTIAPGSIFGNNIEFVSIGMEANYYLTSQLGATLGYTSAISGQNIAANPAITGGVFLDIH